MSSFDILLGESADMAQVPAIHAAFRPSEEDLGEARAVLAAFLARPQTGAFQLNGRTIDRSHLLQAQPILEQADD